MKRCFQVRPTKHAAMQTGKRSDHKAKIKDGGQEIIYIFMSFSIKLLHAAGNAKLCSFKHPLFTAWLFVCVHIKDTFYLLVYFKPP